MNLTSFQIVYFSDETGGNVTDVTFFYDILSYLRKRTMSPICIKQAQGSASSRHTTEALTERQMARWD